MTVSAQVSPVITSTTPADGAVNVLRDVSIVAVPDPTDVDPATVDSNAMRLLRVSDDAVIPSAVNTTGGGDSLTLTPLVVLEPNTAYRFEVTSSLETTTGDAFTPFSMTFTTGSETSGSGNPNVEFEKVEVATGGSYTTLTIGPDGKLYGLVNNGEIHRWDINTDGTLANKQTINSLQNAEGGSRLAIGLDFDPDATAGNLIAWVSHTTFGFGGMPDWEGKITRLSGADLETVQDYVVRLPRSAKDHVTNGIDFGPDGALYFNQGSNSAMGAPDNAWSFRPERQLTAAVLRLDVDALENDPSFPANLPLDVKTEDDGTYDAFAPGAPLTVFGSGTRNHYDLAWHSNGQLYVPTNGSASGGNAPGTPGTLPDACNNRLDGVYSIPPDPSVPAENNISTRPDLLFRVVEGGYYGHPNPARCEWVLNGGNPTSGSDELEVSGYPVGTLPDRNWRGAAYNFQNSKSPNGIIEYRSNTFNNALKGKLLVVRYSGGDDIIVLTPGGANLDIVDAETGITGFTNFNNPLDLTENTANGHIYVSEYGGSKITLLRPVGSTPTPEGDVVTSPDELIFSAVKGTSSDPESFTITNTGTGDLSISDISLVGADASDYTLGTLPTFPTTLLPNDTLTVDVTFSPANINGAANLSAAVRILSDAPGEEVYDQPVYGLRFDAFESSNEPPLAVILDTLGFNLDNGWTDLKSETTDFPLGEEIIAPLFVKAGVGPVTLEPVARFSPNFLLPFGWYENNDDTSAPALNEVGVLTTTPEHQTLYPELDSGGTSFDPGLSIFGIYTDSPSHTAYTEDALNALLHPSQAEHAVRVYPMKDRSGNLIPNSFLIGFEEASNGDYQDYVFVLSNVIPADQSGFAPNISVNAEKLLFAEVVGDTSAASTVTISNDGLADLSIGDISLSGADTGEYGLSGLPTFPVTITSGSSITVDVTFTPTSGGLKLASLDIDSDDPGDPTVSVELRGAGAPNDSYDEPSLQLILDLYEIPVNVGDDNPLDAPIHSTDGFDPLIGEEVEAQTFFKASADPVTVELIAVYTSNGDDPAFGWYTPGDPNATNEVFVVADGSERTVSPELAAGSVTSFDPGNSAFGLYSFWPAFGSGNRTVYTEDVLNTWHAAFPHKARIFPYKDSSGAIVPNTYIYAPEQTDNGVNDFNDIVVVISNVMPAGELPGGSALYREVFPNDDPNNDIDITTTGWDHLSNGTPTTAASKAVGNPTNLDNILNGLPQGLTTAEQQGGFAAAFGGGSQHFTFTTEQLIDRAQYEVTQISWYQGHNSGDTTSYVALQIGGQWYVSTQGFTNPAVGSGDDFQNQAIQQTFAFTTAAGSWATFDETTLSIGSPLASTLPAGNITGFGLYSEAGSSFTMRFDTYQIDVDPVDGGADPIPPVAYDASVTTFENVPVDITLETSAGFTGDNLDAAVTQVQGGVAGLSDTQYPRSTNSNGSLNTVGAGDWTSGFYPGVLWYLYEYTGDSFWLTEAQNRTAGLEGQKNNTGDHDVGFRIMSSFGNGLRLNGVPTGADYEEVIITAAGSLATRYDPDVGAIRSWDWGSWSYPVIIDNMMNLELLFVASDLMLNDGDPANDTLAQSYYDIAVSHADVTMANFFRPDGSSYHVVDFDPATGAVISKGTHQGFGDETAWSRGQAWGFYGFVMSYRYTGDTAYLDQAKTIASFMLNDPNFPADGVPYWDYDAPNIPNEERDSSSAAIMASALIELSQQTSGSESDIYLAAARNTLRSLASPAYTAAQGTNNNFILMHGVGNKPGGSEVDTPLIYGDYYYVEALLRLADIEASGATVYNIEDAPDNGTLSGTAPNLTYTPNTDFTGADSFQFSVSVDGQTSNIATVSITVDEVPATPFVLYREVFSNATGNNADISTVGWELYGDDTATALTPGSSSPHGGVSNGIGLPTDLNDIVDGTEVSVPDQVNGYVYSFTNDFQKYFTFTDEYTLDRATYQIDTVTWYQGHNNANANSHVAVQIGGQWYVSSTGFSNTAVGSAADFNAQAAQQTFAFTTDAADWNLLDFTPGSSLGIGSALTQPLPDGDITAFGLYTEVGGSEQLTQRFDTYEITVSLLSPGSITIVKDATPDNAQTFDFVLTAPDSSTTPFQLADGGTTGGQTWAYNFQLASAPVPTGFTADTGGAYGLQTNGETYGWKKVADDQPVDSSGATRWRERNGIPLELDTFNHLQRGDCCTGGFTDEIYWEHDLPNGTYQVTVAAGDEPSATSGYDSQHTLNVEGVAAMDQFQATAQNEFNIATVTVEVTDGVLTVDPIGGFNTKLNYIIIEEVTETNTITFSDLDAGTYTVEELVTTGWTLTDLTCDDPTATLDVEGRTATITVDSGEDVTCTFTNTQDSVNVAPNIDTIADQNLEEGQTLSLSANVNDTDGDTVTITVSSTPDASSFTTETITDNTGGSYTVDLDFAPLAGDAGSYDITLTADDGNNPAVTETFTLTVTAPPTGDSTLYREVFPNDINATGDDNLPLTSTGWALAIEAGDSTTPVASNLVGIPTDLDGILDGAALGLNATEQNNGFAAGFGSANIFLATTNEQVIDRTLYEVTEISWYQGHSNAGAASQVVIEIGGQWYASTESFAGPGVGSATNFNAQAQQKVFTFTTDAAAWATFDPATLSVGSTLSSPLPAGDITGFGLFVQTGSNFTLRFDTYQIDVTTDIPTNDPPIIDTIADQSLEEGQTLSLSANVNDPDGDTVTITVSSTPDASSFTTETITDNTGGSYTVDLDFAPLTGDAGSYDITITADDGNNPPVTETFTLTVTAPVSGCPPISTLDCDQIEVSVPYSLTWAADEGGMVDGDGEGTGFTMVDPASNRLTADQPISDPNVPSYEPGNLNVDTNTQTMTITSNKGIQFTDNNALVNGLGVGFDADSGATIITAKILNLPDPGSNNYQQSGVWFGLDEENYVKVVAIANNGSNAYEAQIGYEFNGTSNQITANSDAAVGSSIELKLVIDPATNTATAFYSVNSSAEVEIGSFTVDASLFAGVDHDANAASDPVSYTGLFATHRNSNTALDFVYDHFDLSPAAVDTTLTGTFTLQGRTDYAVDLVVSLYEPGTNTLVNSFNVTASNNNSVGEFTLNGLTPGEYDIYIKHDQYLATMQTVTLVEGPNTADFGEQRAGDANNDNVVDALDFSTLASTYNLIDGEAGYDGRADFNGDDAVGAVDFSLLASNFNVVGAMVPTNTP